MKQIKFNKSIYILITVFSLHSCKDNSQYKIDDNGKITIINKKKKNFIERKPLSSNKEINYVLNKIENEKEIEYDLSNKSQNKSVKDILQEDEKDIKTTNTLKNEKEIEYDEKLIKNQNLYSSENKSGGEKENKYMRMVNPLSDNSSDNKKEIKSINILDNLKNQSENQSNPDIQPVKKEGKIIRLGLYSTLDSAEKAKVTIESKYKTEMVKLKKIEKYYALYIGPFQSEAKIESELNQLLSVKIYDFIVINKNY